MLAMKVTATVLLLMKKMMFEHNSIIVCEPCTVVLLKLWLGLQHFILASQSFNHLHLMDFISEPKYFASSPNCPVAISIVEQPIQNHIIYGMSLHYDKSLLAGPGGVLTNSSKCASWLDSLLHLKFIPNYILAISVELIQGQQYSYVCLKYSGGNGYMHVMNMVPWDILSLVFNVMLQQLGCDHRSDEITPSNLNFFHLFKVEAMETSHPLSIESFSYSWLVNLKPSLESLDGSLRTSLDASDEASFIEMDPRMPPSKRFFRNSQDFKFDFPISQSPLTLVDADELFSNGYLMPLFVESLKMEAYEASDDNPSLPSSSHVPKSAVPNGHSRCPSLKRCRTLSRRIFLKYLNFLRPLCRRLRAGKSGSKSESAVKRTESAKNRGYYSETSPRISVAYSADDWRKSCDSESSIYEAVLHCKRSIGMNKFIVYIN
ncbi:hypothetical protein VNO78_32934 [Psophocarpus tetragonolobus]|uniref:Uncharacterized protein n=1 Tax=Psophocarpus tetragonolobus TaxID=3891 RepID=A0AAN9P1H1_PSOTE